ncbi:MAG: 4Fe-4S dicluster domain-containing protein [Bacillota bacterium]
MKRIYIDQDLCEACKNCVLACMARKTSSSIDELDLSDITNQSANFITQPDNYEDSVPLFCRHCAEADCVEACMSGALSKDANTGVVSVDQDKCVGCWMCIMSCPYGLVFKDKLNEVAFKCDLCADQEETSCIQQCPTGAIRLIEVEQEEVIAG